MKIHQMFPFINPRDGDVLPHKMVVSTELLGLEIELEGIKGNTFLSEYWKAVDDGSLRNNGKEFIFREPLGGLQLFNALADVSKHFNKFKPDTSWRCSTHVHMNVTNMTVQQLKLLLIAATVYELPLFKCSGMNRYKSNFCPAYGFAQDQIMILSNAWHLTGKRFITAVTERWSKYSALNLLPITDKGSVEFRTSNAVTNAGALLRLCNRFLTLKKIAMEWTGTEQGLINHLAETPIGLVFNRSLVGASTVPIVQDDVLSGAILANDMVNLYTYRRSMATPTGTVGTVLTSAKVDSMVRSATHTAESNRDWRPFRDRLIDMRNSYEWLEIPTTLAQEMLDKFGVSKSYIIPSENYYLLND